MKNRTPNRWREPAFFFRSSSSGALGTGVLLLAAKTACGVTLTNPSFESDMSGLGLDNMSQGNWVTANRGTINIVSYGWHDSNTSTTMSFPGWTGTRATSPAGSALPRVEVLNYNYNTDMVAADGNQYLMVATNSDFASSFPTRATFDTEMVGLTVGEVYDVSFAYAGGNEIGIPSTARWDVSTGSGGPVSFDPFTLAMVPSPNNFAGTGTWPGSATGWVQGHFQFTAESSTQVLEFLAVANGDPAILYLDNLVVTQVPEATSVLLCGAGAVALLMRRARR